MIRVLYDHQMFSIQQYGGISRYFANLYSSYKGPGTVEPHIAALYSKNHYISKVDLGWPRWLGKLWLEKKSRRYRWNRRYAATQIKKGAYDVLHPTYYDAYFLQLVQKPYVITVHDMIYELYPQFFEATDKFVLHKREVIEKAAHLIAISHATKADLQQLYGIADDRISVIHHGHVPLHTGTLLPNRFGNYLLFVGERSNYKNFNRMVEAVAPIIKEFSDLQLVCAGGGAFDTAEQQLLAGYGIANRCLQVSAGNELLYSLYVHARLFVFPSLYEGFGFPLLEAFEAGCPVAASNTASFREVGGEAVHYFDPNDVDSMRSAIHYLLTHQQQQQECVAQGKRRLQLFTMQQCVQQTAAVYQQVANSL